MNVTSHVLDFTSNDAEVSIVPIGDVHGGHVNCDEKLLRQTVKRIEEDPNAYWCGMGDYTESIWRTDRRHREDQYAHWLHGEQRVWHLQREWVIEQLAPIADKCLFFLQGNHELHALQKYGVDMYHCIGERLFGADRVKGKLPGIHTFCRVRLERVSNTGFRSQQTSFIIYAHHGFGGGDLAGSKALKLERLPGRYEADLYLMGHTHDRQALSRQVVSCSRRSNKVMTHQSVAAYTGSFLQTIVEGNQMYAEEKGYQPLGHGTIEVRVCFNNGNPQTRVVL